MGTEVARGGRFRSSVVLALGRANAYLGIDSNDLVAFLASVGEHILVALDAVRMVVAQHVPLTGQALVALPAAEVARVPVLGHCLRILAAENQLQMKRGGGI